MSNYLRAHQGTARYEVAAQSATQIGGLIVRTPRPIVILTSYGARVFTVGQKLKELIAAGEVRYAFLNSPCPHRLAAKNPACSAPAQWIRAHATDISRAAGLDAARCSGGCPEWGQKRFARRAGRSPRSPATPGDWRSTRSSSARALRTLLCLVELAVDLQRRHRRAHRAARPAGRELRRSPLAQLLADPAVQIVVHAGRQDIALARRVLGTEVTGCSTRRSPRALPAWVLRPPMTR